MARRLNWEKSWRGPTWKAPHGCIDTSERPTVSSLDPDARGLREQAFYWLHRAEELAHEGKNSLTEVARAMEYWSEAKKQKNADRT